MHSKKKRKGEKERQRSLSHPKTQKILISVHARVTIIIDILIIDILILIDIHKVQYPLIGKTRR